jgi:hypothetical protein
MKRRHRLPLLLAVASFLHFGLSVYWLSTAIGCGASETCAGWVKWTEHVVSFPVFEFIHLVDVGGPQSSGELFIALLLTNSVLVGMILMALGYLTVYRRVPPNDS